MKRLCIILGLIILLLDFAEDGVLGKPNFIIPPCPKHTLSALSHHNHHKDAKAFSGKGSANNGMLPTAHMEIRFTTRSQPLTPEVVQTLRLIDDYLLGSSGGIPL